MVYYQTLQFLFFMHVLEILMFNIISLGQRWAGFLYISPMQEHTVRQQVA